MRIGAALKRRREYLAEKNKPETETAACRTCSRIFERAIRRKSGQALAEKDRAHHCSDECRQKARHGRPDGFNQAKGDAYWETVKMDPREYAEIWRDRKRSSIL